jgi:hypothetical protein
MTAENTNDLANLDLFMAPAPSVMGGSHRPPQVVVAPERV